MLFALVQLTVFLRACMPASVIILILYFIFDATKHTRMDGNDIFVRDYQLISGSNQYLQMLKKFEHKKGDRNDTIYRYLSKNVTRFHDSERKKYVKQMF